jgi:mutator protein MutT
MRNSLFAVFLNKLFRTYWFIVRPITRGVKVLIFNEGKILMIRQTYYPNTWTFPGGGIHKCETPLNAVIRECKEEVGIQLNNPEYIGDICFNHEYKRDTVSVYKETVSSLEVHTDWKEVAEAGWFKLDKLPNMGKNAKSLLNFVYNR